MMFCKARWVQQIEAVRKSSSSPWLLLSCSPYSDTAYKRSKATPLQERKMIDRFKLHVKGGDGGNGCCSFRRSRHARYGTPDGGNGGRGGDVILHCTSGMWDFRSLRHHFNGKRGGNGVSKNKIGSRGEDKVVQVPVGTVIHLVQGDISSVTERQISEACDPWEIPGTLTTKASESNERSGSSRFSGHTVQEMHIDRPLLTPCTERGVQKSTGPQETSQLSLPKSCSSRLPSSVKSGYHREVSLDNDDEQNGGKEVTSYDDYNGMSQDELEDEDGNIQFNVAELTEEGEQIIVARGGDGGLGNVCFANVTPREKASSDENEPLVRAGLPGSEAVLILELKTIADVGLVGMPNAGKSTLLGAISRAKPTVGNYAFTTLRPNIGKLNYDDVSVTVADIPGLIKGAHENRGLGHAFLRHIERTKILAYVVDLAAGLDGTKGIPPWEQLRVLVSELEYYREGITNRPSLVVANKIDEEGTDSVLEELQKRVRGVPVYPVCAILEEGIGELKAGLRQLVNDGDSAELSLKSIVID